MLGWVSAFNVVVIAFEKLIYTCSVFTYHSNRLLLYCTVVAFHWPSTATPFSGCCDLSAELVGNKTSSRSDLAHQALLTIPLARLACQARLEHVSDQKS